jgi:nucleoside 2-deoxyribosyltransferase
MQEDMLMNTVNVYISGPLTNTEHSDELKAFYETIGVLCQKLGLKPHIPHLVTDPKKHPHVTPREVFDIDKKQVLSSSFLIAYVGEPSLGVGMELAYAESAGIPVITIAKRGAHVSRLARGIPAIAKEIIYSNEVDALKSLYRAIKSLKGFRTRMKLNDDEIASLWWSDRRSHQSDVSLPVVEVAPAT